MLVSVLQENKKICYIAEGELVLTEEGLTMRQGDELTWSASFDQISKVAIAFGDLVTVRVGDELFGLNLKGGNNFVWLHFLQTWLNERQAA